MVKLDLGAGGVVMAGFTAVDRKAWKPKVQVVDLCDTFAETELQRARDVGRGIGAFKPWPWKDESVDEVHCRNLLHLFTMPQRRHFMHELFRILKKTAQARIIVPHWCCNWAYGDPDVQWPPIAEAWFFRLNKEWREANHPECDYTCDFDFSCGYGMHQHLLPKNSEYQSHAITFWKEAAQDTHVTLSKR